VRSWCAELQCAERELRAGVYASCSTSAAMIGAERRQSSASRSRFGDF
jgi:hypothetical protein